MNQPVVVPIVEGHSEVQSITVMLRRLLHAQSRYDIRVGKPVRVKRYKVVRPGELERTVEFAKRRPDGCNAILLLLDADDDCPRDLAPLLLKRIRDVCGGIPSSVVLAKAEFESWFVGSIDSLRGVRGVSDLAESPDNPEEIRDAKRYLRNQMVGSRTYVEVDDQPALAELFDVQLARSRCPSFDKFIRDLDTLLASF